MTISTSRVSRRRFLAGTAALAASVANRKIRAAAPATSSPSPYILHFTRPAATWPDALPVGNGRLGAMVFGKPSLDRIQLNEESIWDGEPRDRNNPAAGAAVPKIRELLFAGKIAEAEALATTDMLSIPRRMPCYQTLGDLHLDFTASGITPDTKVEDYHLELNLDTAIATTTFTHAGIHYTREIFSSAPDQVIIICITSSQPHKLAFTVRLDRPGPTPFATTAVKPESLTLDGQALPVNDNPGLPIKESQTGIKFHARMHAVIEYHQFCVLPCSHVQSVSQQTITNSDDLQIMNSASVTLLIDCATSYRYPAGSAAMQSAVNRNLKAAASRPYADLKSRHIADHQRFFRRAEISFGPDPNAHITTDQRIQHIKDGGEDITLLPIYFQYGRYMLISSYQLLSGTPLHSCGCSSSRY